MPDQPAFRPLPGDPGAEQTMAMFDADSEWILTAPGDHTTAGVEVMKNDGSNHQRCVALQWPGRLNRTTELTTVQLLMSPGDALHLAHNLAHTATWMIENGQA